MATLETPALVRDHRTREALTEPDLLRLLSQANLNAREEEARRIARELHDEAGQLLSAVFLVLGQIAPDLSAEGRVRLDGACELLHEVERRLRNLSHELHPPVLDDLGLRPALELLAEGISARSSVRVSVEGSAGGRLPAPVENAAYRIVQEALTNVMRHAHATRATVQLERRVSEGGAAHGRRDGTLVVRTCDDGVGFDPKAAGRRPGCGLGLVAIRERITALGGRLRIGSAPGRGTELLAEIPVEAAS